MIGAADREIIMNGDTEKQPAVVEPPYRTSRDFVEDGGVTPAVVEAILDALDLDSPRLDPPLYDVLDPDALETLFRFEGTVSVTFRYQGADVTVRNDGEITVRRAAARTE